MIKSQGTCRAPSITAVSTCTPVTPRIGGGSGVAGGGQGGSSAPAPFFLGGGGGRQMNQVSKFLSLTFAFLMLQLEPKLIEWMCW